MDMGGIANFHLIFNMVSTIILLPAIGLLEKIAVLTIKDKEEIEEEDASQYLSVLNILDERIATIPSLGIENSLKVILQMGEVSEKNFKKSMQLIEKFDKKKMEHTQEREDAIDEMDIRVTNYLVKVGNEEVTEQENRDITRLLKIESEFEKIGDYAYKFSKLVENLKEKEEKFSEKAYEELKSMYKMVDDTIIKTIKILKEKDMSIIEQNKDLKQTLQIDQEKYKMAHMERLKTGKCSVEIGLNFIEMLTVYERIVEHCINISTIIADRMKDEEIVNQI